MSATERILAGLRNVVLMNEKVQQLTADTEGFQAQLVDHERRLIRVETIIEMAGGGRAAPALPHRPHG